MLAAEYNTH